MKKILLAILLLPSLALANPIDDKCAQFTVFGAPDSKVTTKDQYICKQNYALLHSCSTKTAKYVLDHVTKQSVSGPAKRKDDFRPDTAVTPDCQAKLENYVGTGYDRGHMSPAAVNTINTDVMSESFFLSNMVPQDQQNNRGIWRILELWVRDQAKVGGEFYVISGPIYDAGYKSINGVGVPTRLYKIVIDAKTKKSIAFILPNAGAPVKDLPKYTASIRDVEKATGINFNPKTANDSWETEKKTMENWLK